MLDKILIRKAVVKLQRLIGSSADEQKLSLIRELDIKRNILKKADIINQQLPTLGKLRLILEQELRDEENEINFKAVPSDNDLKRLALKSAVYDYYMDLPYDPETVAVDYEGDLTARRDNKETDKTDVDLAPNKNKIYTMWMDKLAKLIRENRLSEAEYDEASERGIPQGGAFEKQLDRYRQDFMKRLWQDYNDYYLDTH